MKRLIISFILSVVLHVTAVVAITAMQLLQKPEKEKTKIMYIKPVKLSEIRTLKPNLAKLINKPKPIEKKVIVKTKTEKIASKPVPSPTPFPVSTPMPVEKTPLPESTKKPVKKIDPAKEKIEKEQKAKVAFLRKQPYFKNWPEERIRRLELPPGMKSWEEAKALTEYFDTQYNWTFTPPELGGIKEPKLERNSDVNPYEASPSPEASTIPNPYGTPIPWRLYQEQPTSKTYDVRFYKDNIAFIGTFKEDEKIVSVSYFPFEPQKAKKIPEDPDEKIEVSIPDNIKPEQIKHFNLPLTQEDFQYKGDPEMDRKNKEQVVKDIIKQYELLER